MTVKEKRDILIWEMELLLLRTKAEKRAFTYDEDRKFSESEQEVKGLNNVINAETRLIELRYNPYHDPANGRFTSGGGNAFSGLDKSAKGDIIESGSDRVTISAIEQPIEQQHTGKGNPNAILTFDVDLNNRQKELLESLPEYDSRITVPKDTVNMADLSALTAKTGDEFAMFTKGNERTIIRGNSTMVNTGIDEAKQFAKQGYKWSGHTHPGFDFLCMQPSDGDYEILDCFNQKISVIYNSKGDFRTFEKRGE